MTKEIELSPENVTEFQETLKEDKPVLMLYHMSMCPHCIALKPNWDKAKRALAKNPSITVAKVEYGAMHLLPSELRNISGFPTIQVVQKRKVRGEYFGDRTSKSIREFAESYVTPAPVAASSPKPSLSPKASKAPKKQKK